MSLRHENLRIGMRMCELGKEGGLQRVCCEGGNRSEQTINCGRISNESLDGCNGH